MNQFPFDTTSRARRLRSSAALRTMVRETVLSVSDLIYPLFVVPGKGVRSEIPSMPDVFHHSIDLLVEECRKVLDAGIPAVILFGLPEYKDERGTGAYSDDGIVQQAVRSIKSATPELLVITDVCLCEYTSHGHCGLVEHGETLNDATLPLLAQTAVSHARSGADIIAPSDMMDFRIAAIRQALDEASFLNTPILSYAAKYASAFYGPFREAAQSTPAFGDRRTYQMDPANLRESLKEVTSDIDEGADMIMVKPALAYMDVIRAVREITDLPLVTYNVSGEYAMVKAAAANGWLDERLVTLELLTGLRRAGADLIITYHALDASRWLRNFS